ncbi:Por secretion system C-terminal sorting domain-containing protein [Chryseolinea serpens]|uniref:Por secretion system C-terminal sorting domain-containing protein n=1 Tax=Chryseolinea serpens TaxID=947013 RepID=A0A1M5XAJ9_9BACT|nr:PQQ-dependent sugar dehydrogenase [Chryseolinea serpens]SHH96672.1 Por secretion system C-terminal sorting domain-containing protein [Chryseolinea serpens]
MKKIYALFLFLLPAAAVYAQTYPTDFAQVLVANGISNPTAMTFAPDGRIFVAQQSGALRVIKNGALLAAPFITLSVNDDGERGLIGVTLDPDFDTNHYLYLYHTTTEGGIHNRITRFTADGDVALAGSASIVIDLDPLSAATNHNGGAMHFGKDEKLYVAIGENANGTNAQSLETYHGKLLRLNKDGSAPADNPFPTGSEHKKRIWAYGLRNPFTFSVHPETGRILVNDVGQGTWEEINDATTGGKNFGWPTAEGTSTNAAFTNPIYQYPHSGGDINGCAITGGTFFSPGATNYPSEYVGRYFFQDLCGNWISSITLSGTVTRTTFGTGVAGSGVAITTGNDGNLYFLSRTNGALYKIIYNKTTVPVITTQPASATIAIGHAVTFSVKALGSTPFTYQWQKNDVNIPGAKSSTYSITNAIEANSGKYRVIVSNSAGSTPSNEAMLTVIANKVPVATITTPVEGTTYVAGSTLNFTGTGVDAEDGPLAASAFSWSIDFHHDTHKHDQPDVTGVKSGSFEIPNEGETSANVWYRIILTVTDSKGLKGKDSVDISPRKTTLAFETTPPGLDITLDGQPLTTPYSVESVEGIRRTVGVPSPQTVDHVIYSFASWSNDGTQTQTFATPTDDVTLNARFTFVVGTEHQVLNVQGVSIYPNPSSVGYVNVCLPADISPLVKVRLVDMLSREVSAQEQTVDDTGCFLLSYGKLKKGVYALHLDRGGKVFVQRVVVAD